MSFEEPTFTEESDDLSSVKSDDQSSVKSDDSSGSNRVKFLYSYGGRILPRPGDGKLRYMGGETRVVAANRNISFADLMTKLAEIMGCSVVLKCQLPTEDLDALVSIKSDEDLENMLEEYDRLGVKEGSSKVRAFLFPKSPSGGLKPAMAMALSLDEYVKSSIPPSEFYHNPAPLAFGSSGSHPHQMPYKPGKPPRCPSVNPDNSPVRYAIRSATQIDRIKMLRQQQKPEGQYSGMIYNNNNNNYQYIQSAASPPTTQVRIPGKAPKVAEEYSKKPSHYLRSPYYGGGGLGGFRPQEQFLVQH